MSDGQWDNYTLRVKAEAKGVLKNNKSSGVAIITSHMLVGADGNIIAWVVPAGKRIEPTKAAMDIVETLLEGLSGKVG